MASYGTNPLLTSRGNLVHPVDMETSLTSSSDRLARFLQHESLGELEGKPLTFEKANGYGDLLCCQGIFATLCTFGMSLICPIQSCCPKTLVKDYQLTLSDNSVVMESSANDCCCHVAHTKKTVPLEKIQDVEVTENWLLTLFGLKQVNVQTAGMNASPNGVPSAEIMASFLREPEQARAAITLAARLQREQTVPGAQTMRRGAAGTADGVLDLLSELTMNNTLTESEAESIKIPALVLDGSPLRKLQDARHLLDTGRITQQEFHSLKGLLIAKLLQEARALRA